MTSPHHAPDSAARPDAADHKADSAAGATVPALTDTHAHLADGQLARRLHDVLAGAAAAGVTRILDVATDLDDARIVAAQVAGRLADPRPATQLASLWCTAGVHPHGSGRVPAGWVAELERLHAGPRCVAVGEAGMDYFHDYAPRDVQRSVFAAQADLALRLGKPLIIHTRGKVLGDLPGGGGKRTDPACFDDVLAVLDAAGFAPGSPAATRGDCGVFHCFEGSADQAAAVLARGFLLSFTGTLTYKANDALRALVATLPRGRVMLETDSPYLSPEPHRKVRPCTPSLLLHTASRLADAWAVPLTTAMATTSANATRLFDLQGGW